MVSLVCVVGPKEEPLAYIGIGVNAGAFTMVSYPYRRTPDLYSTMRGHPARCFQCQQDIAVPKKASRAGQRRFIRHILSHHRRARTLLPWFDRLESSAVILRRVSDG